MSGQQVGTVVGGLVGAYFGYPQLGAAIGGYIGGVVDPTVIKGPSIGDAQQQTTLAGQPIPKCYGHCPPIAPTVVAGDKLARKVKIKHGGKGSTTVTEQEGFIATRAFLVCEGPVAGYARITRNGKLVYSTQAGDAIDADSAAFASQITIYLGDETQGPDPALEAIHGVGDTPYFRGRSYFVVRDDDETQTGGVPNQYRVEVIGGTGTSSVTCSPDADWVAGDTGNAQSIFDTAIYGKTALVAGWNDNLRRSIDGGQTWSGVDFASTTGWSPSTTIAAVWHVIDPGNTVGDWYIAKANAVAVSYDNGGTFTPYLTPVHTIYGSSEIGSKGGVWEVSGVHWAGAVETANTVIFQPLILSTAGDIDLGADYGRPSAIGDFGGNPLIGTSTGKILNASGTLLFGGYGGIEISQFAFGLGFQVACMQSGGYITSTDGFATSTVHTTGTVNGIVFARGRFFRKTAATIDSTLDPSNPSSWVLETSVLSGLGGANGMLRTDGLAVLASTQTQYTAVLPTLYPLPDIAGAFIDDAGQTYGICSTQTVADAAIWKDVAADIAGRANLQLLDHLDIDNMTDEVPGLVLGNATLTATDYLRTLCSFYFADLVEYDDQLHAIRRGGAIAATLDPDHLIELQDEDDDVRTRALQAYQRVTVMYPDPANKYVATPQTAPRTSPDVATTNQISLQCPIPFDATTMARKADILQKIAFLQVEGTIRRALTAEYSRLVPSDAVLFDDRRYLLTKASNDDLMVTFEGTYDRPSAYVSTVAGTSGQAPSSPSTNIKGFTIFAAMNLPPWRAADAGKSGVYVGGCGLTDGWVGYDLYLSTNGGVSEQLVLTVLDEATLGALAADCDSGATDLITAKILHGHVLEVVTPAEIAAGANAMAIRSNGGAEIVQFQTPDETVIAGTWDLSDLTRDVLDTGAAAHAAGDQVMVLDSAVKFIPLDESLAGTVLIFRAVTRGTVPANNPTHSILFDAAEYIEDGGTPA